ncbi:MAG: amidophosphoribosyltransferase [Christensenellaceae bacterium]|jgi:amidophosphoribosyltransferase
MYQKDKLREECAVFAVSTSKQEAAGITYNALLSMQHRGQEGAGIAVLDHNSIYCHKNIGLVSEAFGSEDLSGFPKSSLAIGHTRYSTTGNNTLQNVQPFITEYLTGRIATAHNGNITNAKDLRSYLEKQGLDFAASSDTEVLSALIAYNTRNEKSIHKGVSATAQHLKGAYSFVVLSSNEELVAMRDPHGFRPLCIGKNASGIAIASESCALDSCGFQFVRDIRPGEMIVIENGEITHSEIVLSAENQGICIFEYVYFARPDSVIDGQSVYEARYHMGRTLAKEYPVEADIVCGVPDSGLDAAMGYAHESGLPFVTGFVKNRYIGRSFIYPVQSERESAVSLKLNPLKANVAGKRIVLVDDSIVRGTTSAPIVKALRNAGAKEVHMRLSSPPFKHTCHFGIDIGAEENLIANKLSLEEIRAKIGVDTLGYISHDGLIASCEKASIPFCTGCFTGEYGASIGSYTKTQFES